MEPNVFKKLVEKAQSDSKFFHDLVFDADNAISKLDDLDRHSRTALLTINPAQIIATMVGEISECGGSVTCSCTSGTCGSTCGGSTCSVTCSGDSCGNTCGDSCGYTTNFEFDRLSDINVNPVTYEFR